MCMTRRETKKGQGQKYQVYLDPQLVLKELDADRHQDNPSRALKAVLDRHAITPWYAKYEELTASAGEGTGGAHFPLDGAKSKGPIIRGEVTGRMRRHAASGGRRPPRAAILV